MNHIYIVMFVVICTTLHSYYRIKKMKEMVIKLDALLDKEYPITNEVDGIPSRIRLADVFSYNEEGHGDIMSYTPQELKKYKFAALYFSGAVGISFDLQSLYLGLACSTVFFLFCNNQHRETYVAFEYVFQREGSTGLVCKCCCKGNLYGSGEIRDIFQVFLGQGSNRVS
jgi:hypothetical protein